MLSCLSAAGVERRLRKLPGIKRAGVNYVSGSATVEYDESVTDVKTIKACVQACGYHCAGEMLPKHVCEPRDPPATTAEAHADHDHHAHNGGHATAALLRHAEHPPKTAAGKKAAAHAAQVDSMAHEMGHGAGHDMHAMARDMRNRFFVALAFSIPILVYSPMGGMFAAAVTLVAAAVIGKFSTTEQGRARRLAFVSMAGIAGFLLGPMLGVFIARIAADYLQKTAVR